MIDIFTLALTHGLIALALWRMLFRADLDIGEGADRPVRRPWQAEPRGADGGQGGD